MIYVDNGVRKTYVNFILL